MRELIYFHTRLPLDKNLFEQFLQARFHLKNFVWTGNFMDFCVDNPNTAPNITCICLETSDKGFSFHYSVFGICDKPFTLRQRIEIYKEISSILNIEILSTDDEVCPYSWVLIEPNGQTSTVLINMDEEVELIVEQFTNFSFGFFKTIQPLQQSEIEQLKTVIKCAYAELKIEDLTNILSIDGDFNKFENLSKFKYHYQITPIGKNQWLDKSEKSELFIAVMQTYQQSIQKDLCIFPADFYEVKNIRGGNDMEKFCILLTDLGQEKIIYKEVRAS